MNLWLIVMPFVSALLGWLFNSIYANYIVNNYLPQFEKKLFVTLGKKSAGLLNIENIGAKIADPELIEKSMPTIEKHIDHFFEVKLQQEVPMLAMFAGNKITDTIKKVFINQLRLLFPDIMKEILYNAEKHIDISEMLQTALQKIDWKTALATDLKSPLKKFRLAGLLAGFLIGIINLIIFYLLH